MAEVKGRIQQQVGQVRPGTAPDLSDLFRAIDYTENKPKVRQTSRSTAINWTFSITVGLSGAGQRLIFKAPINIFFFLRTTKKKRKTKDKMKNCPKYSATAEWRVNRFRWTIIIGYKLLPKGPTDSLFFLLDGLFIYFFRDWTRN